MKSLDLTGKRFGKLLVKNYAGSWERKSGERTFRRWLCLCDCGKEVTLVGQDLCQGRTRSCGCSRRKYDLASLIDCYNVYKYKAERDGLYFQLSPEEFSDLTGKVCNYCGDYPKNICKGYRDSYVYNGLDRVDNTQGYLLSNVVPCCEICNKAKRHMTLAQFEEWLDRLVRFRTACR